MLPMYFRPFIGAHCHSKKKNDRPSACRPDDDWQVAGPWVGTTHLLGRITDFTKKNIVFCLYLKILTFVYIYIYYIHIHIHIYIHKYIYIYVYI